MLKNKFAALLIISFLIFTHHAVNASTSTAADNGTSSGSSPPPNATPKEETPPQTIDSVLIECQYQCITNAKQCLNQGTPETICTSENYKCDEQCATTGKPTSPLPPPANVPIPIPQPQESPELIACKHKCDVDVKNCAINGIDINKCNKDLWACNDNCASQFPLIVNQPSEESQLLDYGDAMDPTFPSLKASNGAMHANTQYEWLGLNVTRESNSLQINLDDKDDGITMSSLYSLPPCAYTVLPVIISVKSRSDPAHVYGNGKLLYLNLLFDWDLNGKWQGAINCVTNPGFPAPEHAVVNYPIDVSNWPQGVTKQIVNVPLTTGPLTQNIWIRATLTYDQKVNFPWNGTGKFNFGETEDYGPSSEPREGINYHKEGNIIVYHNRISSEKNDMMERFAKGDLSEEEMRKIAKEKQGQDFSEMKLQKEMMESKERLDRKETFSYTQEGSGKYNVGPSYEGYSKEHMIFGAVFSLIGDNIDPREIKQYCNDPNKIADIAIAKLKEEVGELNNICSKIKEQESKCEEYSKKGCSQMGTSYVKTEATEMEKLNAIAYSCPPNENAIIEACKKRNSHYMDQRLENIEDKCRKKFDYEGERLNRECQKFKENVICNKEDYIKRCLGGIKKENFEMPACTADAKVCPDGSHVSRDPSRNCEFKPCQIANCPQPIAPSCAAGTHLEKKTDDKGCVYYYCATVQCKEISKPACNADERLGEYYDSAGCISGYQCLKIEASCPAIDKPSCSQGQSLTTKYDNKYCIVGYECVSVTSTSQGGGITGSVVVNTYDNLLKNCESSWLQQEKACSSIPASCDKESFIDRCTEQENKNYQDFASQADVKCKGEASSQIRHMQERCLRIDEDRQRCTDESLKRCSQMAGLAEQCPALMTEERVRQFIIEEAGKRCKFTNIIENEEGIKEADKAKIILAVLSTATKDDITQLELFVDNLEEELKLEDTTIYKGTINPNNFGDVKLLPFVVNAKISAKASSERAEQVKTGIVSRQKAEEAATELVSLRDSDIPNEYLYLIEDQASDVLNVSDKLKEIEKKDEGKGFGYKLRLFLGLARAAEKKEISQLDESKKKLSASIDVLASLADEVPSDVAKAILKKQVENLKAQQQEITALIEAKEKKARGLFGIFS